MKADFDHYRRLVATGFTFVVFGVSAVALSLFVFLPLQLLPCRRATRAHLARQVIHLLFRQFVWLIVACRVMRLQVIGADRLRTCRNMVVLANHPTLIDVIVLLSILPPAGCIVKRSLWRNPLVATIVRSACYISNDSAERLIDDCSDFLLGTHPLIIFPEGTRSRQGALLKFHRGASYVALRSGRPILPVILRCDPPTLGKEGKWYRIPSRAFQLTLDVREPLEAARLVDVSAPPAIAARRLTAALETYFARELACHG